MHEVAEASARVRWRSVSAKRRSRGRAAAARASWPRCASSPAPIPRSPRSRSSWRTARRRVRRRLRGGSSYITGLIQRDAAGLQRVLASAPEEERFEALRAALAAEMARAASMAEAMSILRRFKAEVALLTLADLAGAWPVMQVMSVSRRPPTRHCARRCASCSGPPPRAATGTAGPGRAGLNPATSCWGWASTALTDSNYSSDIDLIISSRRSARACRAGLELQSFFVRFARSGAAHARALRRGVRVPHRPAAAARRGRHADRAFTAAALHYYEAFGQNWERAALIKARPVAGDIEAGRMLLSELAPFVWRKHLDFAAIADIHAMKRQIRHLPRIGRDRRRRSRHQLGAAASARSSSSRRPSS